MNIFGQKSFYAGKRDCIRAKVVVFGQKWLCSAKWLYSGKSGCIREKVVVIGQK